MSISPSAFEVAARPSPVELRPDQTAVIVVDMQNDFATPGGMFDRAGIDIGPIAPSSKARHASSTQQRLPEWSSCT